MKILGVNISHNASICQITDGSIDFYFEEDRFNKLKSSDPQDFPAKKYLSIEKHVTEKPDYVVIATNDRRLREWIDPTVKVGDDVIIDMVMNQIRNKFGNVELVFQYEHHLYHAFSGYYFSNFDEALCIVMDGGGAFVLENWEKYREVESVYYLNKTNCICHKINLTTYTDFDHINTFKEHGVDIQLSNKLSSGLKFDRMCHRFGDGMESGKLMGFASYGNLTGDRPEDLARQLQQETLLDTIELIKESIKYHPTKNIILSGGYALNCVNNYEYLKAFPDYNFFVDPAAHDGGTAIGAAMWLYRELS